MRRLRPGEIVAGAAALLLLVSTFLEWYTVRGRTEGLSAWAAFTVVDVLVCLVALLGIALFASQIAGRGPSLPVALEVVTTTLALAATLLVLYRILNQPGPNEFVAAELGAFLGFVSALAIAAGGWTSMRDEQWEAPPVPADERPAPPPEGPREPAPPPEAEPRA